ncbi:MAG TPA: polysaccharide deacetylase family protein [Thermoanaerobacterales bacterium]|uniref:polysaccharide deacetylase family protein n=1 Tax=Tepidanaerobacter sp. GT38 TaxID=2722793 RepID=UPI0017E8C787|nr:polysaccharide deacetylase family protein [Tepidanaerobacter sp. GT38]MCG1011769.1 polysaccharide deacetylase family protein [Tepidanaerobacter sp. GT38]HHY42270.1 polysaccharide deacetylase family protein [Thermoanaerobacterales bacterium]
MAFYTFKVSKKIVSLALFLVIVVTWVFLTPSNYDVQVFGQYKPIYEGSKDKKIMAFTCNVAWGNEYIPPLLEIFKEKNVKATFFIEGRWAEKYPDLLKLIYDNGHEIGNHGYSHAHHAQLSYEQNLNEIKKAEQVIEDILGVKTTLFAPPYGEFSEQTVKAANSMNYRLIMWTIDTIDWKKPGVDYIVNKVLDNKGNGKIVLMHPTEDTVKAMPTIIDNLHREGFKITTVGELLAE